MTITPTGRCRSLCFVFADTQCSTRLQFDFISRLQRKARQGVRAVVAKCETISGPSKVMVAKLVDEVCQKFDYRKCSQVIGTERICELCKRSDCSSCSRATTSSTSLVKDMTFACADCTESHEIVNSMPCTPLRHPTYPFIERVNPLSLQKFPR